MGLGGGGASVSASAPAISSIRISTSAYGRAIPLVYGKTRVASNVIWYQDFTPHEHSQQSGGKGGGGVTSTSYTYSVAVMLGLCEGAVGSVGQVWVDKSKGALSDFKLSLFNGADTQGPLGYATTNHPDQALSYRGTAYLAAGDYDLKDSASLPNISAEVVGLLSGAGGGTHGDVNVADVLRDLLTDPAHGVGLPAERIGSLSAMRDYCQANGLFVSPCYTEQETAADIVDRLATIANVGIVYSGGVLKFVPYSDEAASGNGAIFTPDRTPVYELNDNDFLGDDDPVQCTRKPVSDAYNHVQGTCYDRKNEYNEAVVEAKDQANIELTGLRTRSQLTLHEICDTDIARRVVQQVLQHDCYVRNTYAFTLGVRYSLIEPMDILNISDAGLGLVSASVRVLSVEENENGDLDVVAEEFPEGSLGPSRYAAQSGGGYAVNVNAPAGPAHVPVIFEPPLWLSGQPEIWIAASGGDNWGGCNVWLSDDNASYALAGTIDAKARHGVLATALAAAAAGVDTLDTVVVDLGASGGTLEGVSKTEADDLVTLCYAGGELFTYRDATLVDGNRYTLAYLNRGAYGTPAGSHAAGLPFVRVDDTLFKYPYRHAEVGKTVYLKLQSFNHFGAGLEDLADVPPLSYAITGAAFGFPSPQSPKVFCTPDADGHITRAKVSVTFSQQFDATPDGLLLMLSVTDTPNAITIASGGTGPTLKIGAVDILARSDGDEFTIRAGSTTQRLVVRPPSQPLDTSMNLAGMFWAQYGASGWRKVTSYDETGFNFAEPFDVAPAPGQPLNWIEAAWTDERPLSNRMAYLSDGTYYEILRWGGLHQIGQDFYLTDCVRGQEGTTPIAADGRTLYYFPAPGVGTQNVDIPLASFRQENGVWVADTDLNILVPAGKWVSMSCVVYRQRADTGVLRSTLVPVGYGGPL